MRLVERTGNTAGSKSDRVGGIRLNKILDVKGDTRGLRNRRGIEMTFRRLEVRQIQRIPLVGTVVRRIAAVPFVVKIVRAVQKTRLAARCGGGDRLAVHLNLPAGTPPRSAGIVNATAEVDDNTPLGRVNSRKA